MSAFGGRTKVLAAIDHRGRVTEDQFHTEMAAGLRELAAAHKKTPDPFGLAAVCDAQAAQHESKITPESPSGVRPPIEARQMPVGVGHAGTSLPAQAVPALSSRGGAR